MLQNDPTLKVKFVVYVDSIFQETFNEELTKSRAKAIFRYYKQKYNSLLNRIYVQGGGSKNPIKPFGTPESALNDRVVILFNKKIK